MTDAFGDAPAEKRITYKLRLPRPRGIRKEYA